MMVNMIPIGEKVQDMTAKAYFPSDDSIKEIRIPSKNGRWSILTFYPGDFTFVCATDIEAFMSIKSQFDSNGADLYAISTDSVFSHKGWAQTSPRVKKSTIPMIEDFTKKITSSFGFINEASGASRRGVVILDPDGKIQYMSIFNDGLGKDAEHIFNAFMGLKQLHDTPAKAGHMCAIPANWKAGSKTLDIDVVKDIGKL